MKTLPAKTNILADHDERKRSPSPVQVYMRKWYFAAGS